MSANVPMELFTKIDLPRLELRIDHTMRGLMLGSCFAESIADRMRRAKFTLTANPFGVLYNPASIGEAIDRLNEGRQFTHDDLSVNDDLWFSFAHHGSFSALDPDQALDRMNCAFREGTQALHNADYVAITLGTAWTYRLKETGAIVANCHKLPASKFTRSRLSVTQISEIFRPLLEGVLRDKRVLFTVSPIRHIKDGLSENALSKATLLVAVRELERLYANVEYFPAYEIMIDELRDYRFYKEDMVHPSDQAVDYIWSQFRCVTMDEPTRQLINRIESVDRAMNHRPFNPDSPSHAKFKQSMLRTVKNLSGANPNVDFNNELNFFKL